MTGDAIQVIMILLASEAQIVEFCGYCTGSGTTGKLVCTWDVFLQLSTVNQFFFHGAVQCLNILCLLSSCLNMKIVCFIRLVKSAVKRQIEYGKLRGVPWGISESGYNSVDIQQNYQYRAFGVPGLGLKRGLSEDLVIAPYATALALDGYAGGSMCKS